MWILVLDRSGSMGDPFSGAATFAGRSRESDAATKLDAAKQTLREHLAGLGAVARVVLIAFDRQTDVVYDGPSNDYTAVGRALDGVRAGGGTEIAAALSLGAIIDVTLIDATEEGEQVARAVAFHGAVSAVTSASQLLEEVGKAKAAQDEQRVAAEALAARFENKTRHGKAARRTPGLHDDVSARHHAGPLVCADRDPALGGAAGRRGAPDTRGGAGGLGWADCGGRTGGTGRSAWHVAHAHPSPWRDCNSIRCRQRSPGMKISRTRASGFRAVQDTIGKSAFGRLEITFGSLPIAHLGIAINVRADAVAVQKVALEPRHANVYEDVFASYSSKDAAIVQACRAVYWGLGIHLVVDKQTLRAGQEWDPALREVIDRCDLFQLFWSSNASSSIPVREEYRYALARLPKRSDGFIRPVVWEQPPPEIPADLK